MSASTVAARKQRERREDLDWMARSGETTDGAARRLGISTEALERWLLKHDRDIQQKLRANDEFYGRTA